MTIQTEDVLYIKEMILIAVPVITLFTAAIKYIILYLNKPIKAYKKLYKKAGVSTWRVKLFLINIPIRKIPDMTKIIKVFFSIVITTCIAGSLFFSYICAKILVVPQNWTALTVKETREDFLITKNKAEDFAFKPSWYIDKESCQTGKNEDLVKNKTISPQLSEIVCEILTNEDKKDHLDNSISEFHNSKTFILVSIAILVVVFMWLGMSIFLSWTYTNRLRRHILKEQEKSFYYLT
ncbi:DUF6216 family protein [Pectobacterium brasiliense]|uniref:DUF6216 family protein n=1 Tax=Pectobacterium brasiliense TaxID=180957 RepID=UPI0005835AA5|nr:DUF6216 family protein [Pectobacterium brasiliense]KHT17921.1 hypothetical protein RC95_13595 [Pectobacterium brasiliense]